MHFYLLHRRNLDKNDLILMMLVSKRTLRPLISLLENRSVSGGTTTTSPFNSDAWGGHENEGFFPMISSRNRFAALNI